MGWVGLKGHNSIHSLMISLESIEEISSLAGRCKNKLCKFKGIIINFFSSKSLDSGTYFKCWAAFPFVALTSSIAEGPINSSVAF